jgi:acyl-CoA reductase-like NAD-dependent aldehyde dehydrogenase
MTTTSVQTIRGETAPRGFEDLGLQAIGGKWSAGSSTEIIDDLDPWTGELLLRTQSANADDVDDAYRAAKEAQPAWAARPYPERSAVLLRVAQLLDERKAEIVEWIVRESGGTHIKAALEWQLVHAGTLEAASYPGRIAGQILPSGIPGKESRVYREPAGIVGIISPWNFPFQLANRSIAPALACGNAIVVKPASDTPVTGGTLLAKLYEEAGLPKGVFNVIIGAGSAIGDALVGHPIPRVISFTGSTPVGAHIAELCGKHVKRTCLELGGNAPFVVLADADVDAAVDAAIAGKFMHQGQICMAINRILVDREIYEAFAERFTARARALKVGGRDDAATAIGPIINRLQLDTILEKVETIKRAGARVLLDGKADGLLLSPVVLADVRNEDAQEELFGPVALLIPFSGDREGLRLANDVPFGLSSAVFGRDLERATQFARRMEAGMTHVNDITVNDEPNTAFGGEKTSGIGRFGGTWAIEEFTTDHWVSVQHTRRTYPF